jgi:hypothetical protein
MAPVVPVRRDVLERLGAYLMTRPMREVETHVMALRAEIAAADRVAEPPVFVPNQEPIDA